MQKSFDVVQIHLTAQHAVALRRHRKETVGHVLALRAAIVRPQRIDLADKRLDMIVGGHGQAHESFLIKLIIAQRIEDPKFSEMLRDDLACFAVRSQHRRRRLVRHVEIDSIRNALLADIRLELRRERRKERAVLFPRRARIPSKDAFALPVHRRDDFGTAFGAPLRKQMRHFQIFDPDAIAHVDPAIQSRKVERIRIVAIFDADQLHRLAFLADLSIERRRKQRRQHHIHAVLARDAQIPLDQFPITLRKHGHAVMRRDAIGVEPVGIDQRLLGQTRVDHIQRKSYLRLSARAVQRRVQRLYADGQQRIRDDFEPDTPPFSRAQRQCAVERTQQFGKYARLVAQRIIVLRFGDRHARVNLAYDVCVQHIAQRRIDPQRRRTIRVAAYGDLYGRLFVAEQTQPIERLCRRLFVRKYFDQRTQRYDL